jgi:LysM repeat protein/pimeloyl-ACP methyl ester carboxylesterase
MVGRVSGNLPVDGQVGMGDADTYRTHKVRAGETFWSIARRELGAGNRYPEIMKLNGFTDATKLQIGTVLKLPGTSLLPIPQADKPLLRSAPEVAAPPAPKASEAKPGSLEARFEWLESKGIAKDSPEYRAIINAYRQDLLDPLVTDEFIKDGGKTYPFRFLYVMDKLRPKTDEISEALLREGVLTEEDLQWIDSKGIPRDSYAFAEIVPAILKDKRDPQKVKDAGGVEYASRAERLLAFFASFPGQLEPGSITTHADFQNIQVGYADPMFDSRMADRPPLSPFDPSWAENPDELTPEDIAEIPDIVSMDEAFEKKVLKKNGNKATLVPTWRPAPGNDGFGVAVSVHGFFSEPRFTRAMSISHSNEGRTSYTLAYDDKGKRQSDTAVEFADELEKLIEAYPDGPLRIDAHSLGGRVTLRALQILHERGNLNNDFQIEVTLIGTPLGGVNWAGQLANKLTPEWLVPDGAPFVTVSRDFAHNSEFQQQLEQGEFPPGVVFRVVATAGDSLRAPDMKELSTSSPEFQDNLLDVGYPLVGVESPLSAEYQAVLKNMGVKPEDVSVVLQSHGHSGGHDAIEATYDHFDSLTGDGERDDEGNLLVVPFEEWAAFYQDATENYVNPAIEANVAESREQSFRLNGVEDSETDPFGRDWTSPGAVNPYRGRTR